MIYLFLGILCCIIAINVLKQYNFALSTILLIYPIFLATGCHYSGGWYLLNTPTLMYDYFRFLLLLLIFGSYFYTLYDNSASITIKGIQDFISLILIFLILYNYFLY